MREENIEKMNFKELRAEVQLLRDELSILKRKYDDALYNLDSDNFSGSYTAEQNDMKAQVKVTANAVSVLVAEMGNYATTEWTSKQITSTVKNYQTKADADAEYDELMTEITQTAGSITSIASKNMNAYFESDYNPNNITTSAKQKSMLCLYEDEYYYYDDFYGEWKEYPSSGLQTMFVQDAEKFALTGNVKISGDLVSGGAISGASISTSPTFHGDGVALKSYGTYQSGQLEVYRAGQLVCYWVPAMHTLNGRMVGSAIIPENNTVIGIFDVTARGDWDFGECDSIYWGKNAPAAVFG